MSKSIASYPDSMRSVVIARRMRNYDPKGGNGIGTLAAKDYYDKHLGAKPAKAKKESPSDIRRRVNRKTKVEA